MAERKPSFREADWPAKMVYLNAGGQFYYSDGLELVELALGAAHMIMPTQPRHLNRQGKVLGAWASVLLEQAAAMAAMSYGYYVTPEQLSLNYHQDCSGGVLHAYAAEKNRGKYLGVYTVDVCDEQGAIIVSGTMTVYFQEQELDFEEGLK